MAITATTALQNKLFQVLTGNQGVPGGSFISFVGGGRALEQRSMQWATKTPPYAGDADADAAMAFAQEVDTIPIAADDWTAGTTSLPAVYRRIWLTQARVPNVELSVQEEAERADAQKYLDENTADYETFREVWLNANADLQLAVLTPRSDPGYLQNLLAARRAANAARDDFLIKGHKSRYEAAFAIIDYYDRLGLQTALQDLINRYDQVDNENLSSTGDNFVPVTIYPNNILEPGGPSWNTFKISETDFSRFRTNSSTNFSVGADLNFLFWTAGASFEWGQQRGFTDISSTGLSVEFEFIRVRLDRSRWFDSFLLMSNSWWWPGATKSRPTFGGIVFSDGVAPRNTTGQWQMIPTEMIVVRNLKVTTRNFNLRTSTFAEEARASASAGFWIFQTKANYSTSTSSQYDHTFTSDDTLNSPQPQIVAFICQLMRKEPNPDLALLPAP
jgi:hypothetical protein